MKTTLELPDALLKEVKTRAVMRGTKLKDEVAELLRKGLDAPDRAGGAEHAVIATDEETGLPVIVCGRPAAPGQEMTPERVASVLMDEEVKRFHETG